MPMPESSTTNLRRMDEGVSSSCFTWRVMKPCLVNLTEFARKLLTTALSGKRQRAILSFKAS